MAGKTLHQVNPKDFEHPFNAGQMVGMLTMLMFIEENKGISQKMIDNLKWVNATNAEAFLKKPAEDIILMVSKTVKDIE